MLRKEYYTGLFYASGPIAQGAGTIYVPSALLDTYKAATGWSTYASSFKAIEGSEWEVT